jgi:hypothetical protein
LLEITRIKHNAEARILSGRYYRFKDWDGRKLDVMGPSCQKARSASPMSTLIAVRLDRAGRQHHFKGFALMGLAQKWKTR